MALGAEALDVSPVNSSYTMPGAMLGTKRMVTALRRWGEILLTALEAIQLNSLVTAACRVVCRRLATRWARATVPD